MILSQNIHWTGQVDPVAFTIFGRDIAWYGIIITLAMLTGLLVATLRCKKIGLTFDPMLSSIVIGGIGMLMALINYPIYKGVLNSRKKKYGAEILKLSDKIMNK